MRPVKYILFVFYGFIFTMVLAVMINYVIDPYRIFLTPAIDGINAIKSQAKGEIFFNRAAGIKNIQPRTLLLGNSRVQWGLRAGSRLWPEDFMPVYNAAIPGSNNQTALAYLKFAINSGNVKNVVFGLDFFSALIKKGTDPRKPIVLGKYEAILGAENNILRKIKNYFLKLSSLDALVDSFLTIMRQKEPFAKNILPNGDNPLNEYKGYAARKGYYLLFRDFLSKTKTSLPQIGNAFLRETDSSPEFDSLKRLIEISKQNNLQLYMYFPPYHSTLIDLIEADGRGKEYKKWKNRVVSLVQSSKNIQLWDFGARNVWTSEPIPKPGDTVTQMKWYWEPGHYKSSLGDKIIGKITSSGTSEHVGTFGQRINLLQK